jgi:hypothetical protein
MVTFAPFFQKQQPFVHSAAFLFLFLSMKQKINTLSATKSKDNRFSLNAILKYR